MGQYYKPVVEIDNKITVYNRDIDGEYTMAKLTEHSWCGNPLCMAISKMFYQTKGKLAWIGDYSEDKGFLPDWDAVWREDGEGLSKIEFTFKGKYIVNHDKEVYIDFNKYEKASTKDDWCLFPLSLLTACGNGYGGGDYSGTCMEYIGTWAWDTISIEDEKPAGYKEIEIQFIERY